MVTRARDIMSGDVTVARDDMSVEEALRLLVRHRITGMPVLDKSGKMVGVLSEYDIIADASKNKIKDAGDLQRLITYTSEVEAVTEDTPIKEILDRFVEKRFRRLPVIDSTNRLVGIISRRDVMRLLYYRAKVR